MKKETRGRKPAPPLESGVGDLLPIGLVGKAMGVSGQSLSTWRDDGFPESVNGLVNTLDVIAWLRGQWLESRDGKKLLNTPEGQSENLERYRAARADMEEISLEEKRGTLLKAEEVKIHWKTILSGVWGKVQRFRDNLPPLLINKTGMQIREIIIEETERAGLEIIKELECLKK